MGKKGREIVELDVEKLVDELNTAYADEWLAYYQYWVTAKLLTGVAGHEVAEELEKLAKEELEHVEELAKRILQLGGVPLTHPEQVLKKSGCGYIEPPKNPKNVKKVIEDALKAEACAIEGYQKLGKMTYGKDFITHQLVMHILQEEIEHEERMENYL